MKAGWTSLALFVGVNCEEELGGGSRGAGGMGADRSIQSGGVDLGSSLDPAGGRFLSKNSPCDHVQELPAQQAKNTHDGVVVLFLPSLGLNSCEGKSGSVSPCGVILLHSFIRFLQWVLEGAWAFFWQAC